MTMQQMNNGLQHRQANGHPTLMRTLFGLGSLGLFLISIVDSSVVPLPIPGSTDILLVLLAAHHTNGILLVLCATVGSLIGGYSSYQIGKRGGLPALERYLSPKYLKQVCSWVERHTLLAVALPAILPPPVPLSPFIVAAGALNVPRNKFLATFGIARGARYSFVGWLGYHFGRHILGTWNRFSAKWGTTIEVAIFVLFVGMAAYVSWKFWKQSQQEASSGNSASARPTAVRSAS